MKDIFYIRNDLNNRYGHGLFDEAFERAFTSSKEACEYLENIDIGGIFDGQIIESLCADYMLIPLFDKLNKGGDEKNGYWCNRRIDVLSLNISRMSEDEKQAFIKLIKDKNNKSFQKGLNALIYDEIGLNGYNQEIFHSYYFEVTKLVLESE